MTDLVVTGVGQAQGFADDNRRSGFAFVYPDRFILISRPPKPKCPTVAIGESWQPLAPRTIVHRLLNKTQVRVLAAAAPITAREVLISCLEHRDASADHRALASMPRLVTDALQGTAAAILAQKGLERGHPDHLRPATAKAD